MLRKATNVHMYFQAWKDLLKFDSTAENSYVIEVKGLSLKGNPCEYTGPNICH